MSADGSITASCNTSTSLRRICTICPITSPSGISPPKSDVTTVSPVWSVSSCGIRCINSPPSGRPRMIPVTRISEL